MFTFSFKPIAGAMVISAWLSPVNAQTVLPVPAAKPSEISAFSDYKKFDDPGVADWRASNDKVRTLGGWRTYLKEAYDAPDATISSPAAPSAVPENPPAGNPRAESSSATSPSPSHSHHHHGGEK